MTKPDLQKEQTAAEKQAAAQSTDSQAAALNDLLQDMLNTKPATSVAMTAGPWLGKVEMVRENAALISSFKTMVGGKRFHIAMIDALIRTQQDALNNNKTFEFKTQAEVEKFDHDDVCDTYLINNSNKVDSDLSRDNDRMIHEWGGQLLGLVPWELTKQTKKWLKANNLPIEEQNIAFFKVTK